MPLSAIDAVSPAFRRTSDLLLKPFRLSMWARLAVIAMLAGEVSGGGAPNFNYNIPASTRGSSDHLLALPGDPAQLALLVTAAVVAGLLFFALFIFLNSIFRFVLFDVIVTGRYRIREGWRRWFDDGMRYFWWQVGLALASLLALALLALPVLLAWQEGLFREPGQHLGVLILGGLVLFLLLVMVMVAGAVIAVFSKDFLVPVMALEKLGPLEGWRRLLPMLRSEQGPYAGYIGMKILLAIVSGVIFGILDIIVLVVLAIPLVLVGIVVGVVAGSLGLTWNLLTIALAVILGGLGILALMFLLALVNVPAAVFFEAYPVQFLGSRYPALGALLQPAPPTAPPATAPEPAPA